MKRMAVLPTRGIISVLSVAFLVIGVTACTCGEPAPTTTTDTSYKLTHTAADAEYILSWDSIVSRCPDIGAYDKQEAFIHRGESAQAFPGAPALNEDSLEAWASCKVVYIAGLPSENLAPLLEGLQSYGAYSYHVLSNNTRDKDVRLSFTGKFVE